MSSARFAALVDLLDVARARVAAVTTDAQEAQRAAAGCVHGADVLQHLVVQLDSLLREVLDHDGR